jgi:hypothetical protein
MANTVRFLILVLVTFTLTWPRGESYAASITVDGLGHNVGPLPLMIYDLANAAGTDVYPLGSGELYLFALFDTGSNLLVIQPNDTALLGLTTAELVDVRLNSLATIRPDLTAPLGSPFLPAQAQVQNINVALRTIGVTLIGTPVASQVVAIIDNTTAVSRGPYGFVPPDDLFDPVKNADNNVDGHDITFFSAGDPGVPPASLELQLERFGSAGTALDGATREQRYLLRNVAFENGGAVVDDQNPGDQFNFFYDTGTSVTIINSRLAAALGIGPGTLSTFDCLGGTNNGFTLDSITMTGIGGDYTIQNASVCVDDSAINTRLPSGELVDSVIGSNLFDQVPIIWDGPGDRLGVGIVPEPDGWVLFTVGLIVCAVYVRRRASA